jgi:hypothetical protein
MHYLKTGYTSWLGTYQLFIPINFINQSTLITINYLTARTLPLINKLLMLLFS